MLGFMELFTAATFSDDRRWGSIENMFQENNVLLWIEKIKINDIQSGASRRGILRS